MKKMTLRELVLGIETYREIFNPPKKEKAILRKLEKEAWGIIKANTAVTPNNRVLTPVKGRGSPVRVYKLSELRKNKNK